jgi:hypothetical protein
MENTMSSDRFKGAKGQTPFRCARRGSKDIINWLLFKAALPITLLCRGIKIAKILVCAILLVPTTALFSQNRSPQVKVFLVSRTQPKSVGGEAQLFADYFQGEVSERMQDKYPCAELMPEAGLGVVLQNNKERELLGSDTTEDMQTLAGAIGAKYLIRLTVTPMGSGQVMLSAKMMNLSKVTVQESMTTISKGGEAAADAIEALAQQFVDSLGSLSQFSKEKCVPTNRWAGTIKYKLFKDKESTSESPAPNDGTMSSTITTSTNHDISVQVGWTGKAQVTVNIIESTSEHKVVKRLINCARRGYSYKSAGMDKMTRMENNVNQMVEATVGVGTQKGRYSISVNAPVKFSGTWKYTENTSFDGGCDKPSSEGKGPLSGPWPFEFYFPSIEGTQTKPESLSGSFKDALGGEVSWSLKRTPMR